MIKGKKYLTNLLIMVGVCFMCYAVPFYIIMFIDVGSYAPFLMFIGGFFYFWILNSIDMKNFKKTVIKEFENGLMEQEQFYKDKIKEVSLDVIKRLSKKKK